MFIDESKDNINIKVFDEGEYVVIESTFKEGDPYLFACKGTSRTLGREKLMYYIGWAESFEKRFEKCVEDSVNKLLNDYHKRERVTSDHNLNIKLTEKANSKQKLSKYILE